MESEQNSALRRTQSNTKVEQNSGCETPKSPQARRVSLGHMTSQIVEKSRRYSVQSAGDEGMMFRRKRASVQLSETVLEEEGDTKEQEGASYRSRRRKSSRVGDLVRLVSQENGELSERRKSKAYKLKNRTKPSPDNVPSTSDEGTAEVESQKSQAIINDEIRALEIKSEDLEKLHDPKPPAEPRKSPTLNPVLVRKLKPASEWNKPKPQPVTVFKPAPPEAPLKNIDYSGAAGPRYNHSGEIVPHSILGGTDEYVAMARKTGEFTEGLTTNRSETQNQLTVKYEKLSKFPKFESVEESNALKNWQLKMKERKRQQDHLAKMLKKAPDQLIMNQADSYRQTQEQRYIIDRTIPVMDYGKGYRIGSEFWKQQERIGNDLTGIHATLTQTEKGYPPPIEHVGVPRTVLKEKGTAWDKPRTPLNKPWHRNAYLEDRLQQLEPVISELDPHNPDMLNLEVVGQPHAYRGVDRMTESQMEREQREARIREELEGDEMEDDDLDPLREHPDVHPEPVFGPSLQFAGQPARWTGDSSSFKGQIGLEARVTFETTATKRTTSFLEISNDGTTAVYFDWKKVPKVNPFDMAQAKVQRFYFNTGSGVILPGDSMKFPFVFKSPNPGVFQEQWEFQTRPKLCGGAALVVTLRGVSVMEDKYKQQRTQLEHELSNKQAQQVVTGILDDIIEGLKETERPASPIDAYITQEETFVRLNPGMSFHNERVGELKNLYLATFPEEERENQQWDLSISSLKQLLMSLSEEDENKQDMLDRLNRAVDFLSFPAFTPKPQRMYNIGYEVLCEMVDRLVGNATYFHEKLGMPEREGGAIPEDPTSKQPSAKSLRDSRDGRHTGASYGSDSAPTSAKSPTERDKRTPSQKSKPEVKDKKPAKDTKAPPKTAEKSAKGGKTTPGAIRRPTAKEEAGARGTGGDESMSVSGDPVLEAKYRDKVYSQAYTIVGDCIDKMAAMLSATEEEEGGPKLPQIL